LIEVDIRLNGEPLGHIKILNVTERVTEFADYKVEFRVERGTALGAHKRMIYGFPRKQYNVFALILQALNTLNEKDLKLERDFDPDQAIVPADMARRLGEALREIQARLGRPDRH
jgi:hypothetical protein